MSSKFWGAPKGVLNPVNKHVRKKKASRSVSTLTLLLGYVAFGGVV